MKLTKQNKKHIDSLSYEELLRMWRFEPTGSAWFQDETGAYISERMRQLRAEPGGMEKHVDASKSIGWSDFD